MPHSSCALGESNLYASTREFAKKMLEGRDHTHGFEHCATVCRHAMEIFDDILEENESETMRILQVIQRKQIDARKVIAVASYLHDVLDHKYECTHEAANKMAAHIDAVCSPTESKAVHVIIDHISYSAEKNGRFNIHDIPKDVLLLRNVVSDADKLEAIGIVGINRCLAFTQEKNPHLSEEECRKQVAVHCDDKLLRLANQYIYTAPGKRRAAPLHDAVVDFRRSINTTS